MKTLLFIAALSFNLSVFAQNANSGTKFTCTISKIEGDLNNDNVPDLVVVTQDTLNSREPFRLQVFFKNRDDKYRLVASSEKLIEARYPEGRDLFITDNSFSEVTIQKGILSVNCILTRGHFEHKFRYQNGNFELIGFSLISSDGLNTIETVDFNLSTGMRFEKSESFDGKLLKDAKRKVKIRPLPKLQDVVPLENNLY